MTLKIKLNTDRETPSGRYPIVLQLIINRKRTLIYSNYKVTLDAFDKEKQRVKYIKGGDYTQKQVRTMNKELISLKEEVSSFISEQQAVNIPLAVHDISERYRQRKYLGTLFRLFEKRIAEKYRHRSIGVAKAYESTYRKLKLMTNQTDIPLTKITPGIMRTFHQQMLDEGLSPNTIAFYFRNLRAVLNVGLPSVDKSQPLFQGISLSNQRTIKRSLTHHDITNIIALDVRHSPALQQAKDIFLLSFFLCGLPLVDLFFMQKHCYYDGYLHFKRHKTLAPISVKVTPICHRLMKPYLNQTSPSPYLFAFIGDVADEQQAYVRYRTLLKYQNNALHRIGRQLHLSAPLTSYVARHTWATLAKHTGASLQHICDAMGHTSAKTTLIYLNASDQTTLDNVNNRVMEPYQDLLNQMYADHNP